MDSNPDPLTKWVIFKEDISLPVLIMFMKLLSMKDDQDSSDWKTENGLEPVFFVAKLRLNNGLKSIDKVLSNYNTR